MTDLSRDAAAPFTWTAEEIRRVGYRAVDLVAEHLARLPDEPVFRPVPPALADAFATAPVPAHGSTPDTILDDFARDVAPYPFGNGHPRFAAWVNSPPTVMGVFAQALAAAMNPSVAGGNHAAVHLERQVVRWFATLLGLPAGTMGLLTSGGSAAAIVALAVARHVAARRAGLDVRAEGVQGSAARMVVYQSAEAHGCHQKAVELLGIGSANLRSVPCDGALRMSPEALDAMLLDDVALGHVPVAVIASAGTVNTGAIDQLGAIAEVCARHGAWLHVDAAYGGPAILSARYREALATIALADSVTVDPHKWLYVPVDAGLVLVRDAGAMRDAFSLVPPYLRTDGDSPWLSEYGIEQTRPFRALKVWMALRYHGLEGYRRLVEHDLALAGHLARRVREAPDLECHESQELSIVCFRWAPRGAAPDRLDALNRALVSQLQLGGRAFVSGTTVGGRFWLRACIVNPRATEADMDALVALVREHGAALAPTSGA